MTSRFGLLEDQLEPKRARLWCYICSGIAFVTSIMAIVFLALYVGVGASADSLPTSGIYPTGTTIKEVRTVSTFSGIHSNGPIMVRLQIGAETAVSVEADSAFMPYVKTILDQNNPHILNIWHNTAFHCSPKCLIHVNVTTPNVTSLVLAGSGDITAYSILSASDLQVQVTGSGSIYADVRVTTLHVGLQGSGNFITSGTAKSATVAITGSGDLNRKTLNTTNTDVKIMGSGDVAIHCSNQLSVSITGSGSVRYSGKPDIIRQIIGSGTIIQI